MQHSEDILMSHRIVRRFSVRYVDVLRLIAESETGDSVKHMQKVPYARSGVDKCRYFAHVHWHEFVVSSPTGRIFQYLTAYPKLDQTTKISENSSTQSGDGSYQSLVQIPVYSASTMELSTDHTMSSLLRGSPLANAQNTKHE